MCVCVWIDNHHCKEKEFRKKMNRITFWMIKIFVTRLLLLLLCERDHQQHLLREYPNLEQQSSKVIDKDINQTNQQEKKKMYTKVNHASGLHFYFHFNFVFVVFFDWLPIMDYVRKKPYWFSIHRMNGIDPMDNSINIILDKV